MRTARQVPRIGESKKDPRLAKIDTKIADAKKLIRMLKDEKRQLLKLIEHELKSV